MIKRERIGGGRGFGLLSLLVTLAVLVIVLGLMVSLARHVRSVSAQGVTGELLRQLDIALAQYHVKHHASPPADWPTTVGRETSVEDVERVFRQEAQHNTTAVVQLLQADGDLSPGVLNDLPLSMYSDHVLRDAWGTPIAYFPHFDPRIGMAPHDRAFFASAGPDQRFFSREDDVYSYEQVGQ